ncbi:hypothetical protein WJX79_001641 [Trebouxia sp. C0005]
MPAAANTAAAPDDRWRFRQTYNIREQNRSGKKADPIWCISFNFVDLKHKDVFASCGGVRSTVYECKPNGIIKVLQAYCDPNPEEEFFVCKWSTNSTTGAPMLLLAGFTGSIRVVDCNLRKVVWTAQGHGDAINDITVHPTRPSLFVTASRDHSLRLWNLETQVCVCTMVGDGAHTNEVLSVDFHASDGNKLLSAGMDHTIKMWNLQGLSSQIEASFQYDAQTAKRAFHTTTLSCPDFSTHKVHWAYVDCVRWFGDIVLSKSVHNKIFLWEPDGSSAEAKRKGYVKCHQEYSLEKAKVWFIRMSLDLKCSLMACGDVTGQVYLWDMHTLTDEPQAVLDRELPIGKGLAKVSNGNVTVRQTAVSYDASIILACCEDGTIWRWDSAATPEPSDEEPSAREEDGESSHASMQGSDEME